MVVPSVRSGLFAVAPSWRVTGSEPVRITDMGKDRRIAGTFGGAVMNKIDHSKLSLKTRVGFCGNVVREEVGGVACLAVFLGVVVAN
ncbi:hypothetical protein GCM10009075_31180 [Sphingomonas trueperi]